jgi:uncharacterized protein (DUF4415 family)
LHLRSACAALISAFSFATLSFAGQSTGSKFPFTERLSYRIEWRLITAGSAKVEISRSSADDWQTNLNLESEGIVTRLYKVLDTYKTVTNEKFCPANSLLDAQEGKRHTITQLTFENSPHRVNYDEHDLVKNSSVKKQLEVGPCTHEIMGALAALREMDIEPGKSTTLPITDGKKMVQARIDAEAREGVTIDGKKYQTIRYEAFLFDNVLYKRKGRLFMWVTDDSDRLPVQFRVQLGFPIGTITIQLDKEQKL